jgi:ArsR family metal-binding transcriptional regulator
MWEVLMDLKNIINKNWDKSNFISLSLDKSKVKLLTDATYFLDEIYEKVPLRTRALCNQK